MALEDLSQALPSYAADIAANLKALSGETLLTPQQTWGCFVAAAHAVATPLVVKAIEAAAAQAGLASDAKTAAKGAAAIMAQNNIYFRAIGLLKNPDYRALRSRLRMSLVFKPGVAQGRLRPLVRRRLGHPWLPRLSRRP